MLALSHDGIEHHRCILEGFQSSAYQRKMRLSFALPSGLHLAEYLVIGSVNVSILIYNGVFLF